MKAPPEKLGSFYLGGKYDLVNGRILDESINYDSRDLTTHAVCFGMTGSGKTGLCICLLEEAALDKVPALIIDPKGDITNLLLQFPELRSEDFLPWVNPDDARRKGLSIQDYSAATADSWRKGLGDWGITKERIKESLNSVDYHIYTPGSEAGIPISIMSSLASPHIDFKFDGEAARDRIRGMVSALIDLMEMKVDPIRSQESILLTNIFEYYWRKDEDLTLEKLIKSVQNPPFNKLGVFDIEAFYPEKKRFELAMAINSLIASPSFSGWLVGEALDIDKLLYNHEGKPCHSIFYLAHLSDSERMFFVTLLLENIITWVRRQQGTTSLRALLYFDEVYGFMPPVAEPSSKRPLMTLLKQARAYGLGLTLVTQNPVDIDYKGLTNTGTWFIGKLQAERDKMKVIEGLKGIISESGLTSDDRDYDSIINNLSSRVFLMYNIHQGSPVTIHSRWAMSYLRGPLTKPQISILMQPKQIELKEPATKKEYHLTIGDYSNQKPSIDPEINQVIIKEKIDSEEALNTIFKGTYTPKNYDISLLYEPKLYTKTSIGYYNSRLNVDKTVRSQFLLDVEDTSRWDSAEKFHEDDLSFRSEIPQHYKTITSYKSVPSEINTKEKIQKHTRTLTDFLLQNSRLKILTHKTLGIVQKPEEDEREYYIRIRDASRERRDEEVSKIQDKYEDKIDKIENKIKVLERKYDDEKREYEARKREEYLGLGESVLCFFIGRKKTTVATTTSRRMRMSEQAKNDMEEAQANIEDLKKDAEELETDLKEEIKKITEKWENTPQETTESEIKPNKSNINIESVALAWIPTWKISWQEDNHTKTNMVPAYKKP